MASNRPDYEVFVSEKRGEKNWYTKIGAAWIVANDGISVCLQANPIDGRIVLFPLKEDAEPG